MIFRLTKRDLQTKFGMSCEILYYDGQKKSIALVMGNIANVGDLRRFGIAVSETRAMK